MEFKGTKGKWAFAVFSGESNCTVYALGNKCLVSMLPKDFTMCTKEETEKEKEEQRYNALLISKAPDLLDMLSQIVKDFETDYVLDGEIVDTPYEWLQDRYKEAKKLIKEATEL